MNKQAKTLLGVAVVAGVGYYFWKQSQQQPKSFANAVSDLKPKCRCHQEELDGVYLCGDGRSLSRKSDGPCPARPQAQVQR
jgi:hypothetical protein